MAELPNSPRRNTPKIEAEEATEAKLCAYLEDALPPAERAEIEQYLASNPAHRKLLAELAAQRQWVMNLPKQAAPPDIAEAFQQQMERSMLLDDASEGAGAAPLNRWPQRLLVAALVVLAAGLGWVVYLSLPGSSGSAAQRFAANPPPAPAPPVPASASPLAAANTYQRAAAALAPPPPPPPRPNIAALVPSPVTRPAVAESSASMAEKEPHASAAEPSAPPVVVSRTVLLTAATTQPAAVQQRIADFFTASAVQFYQMDGRGMKIQPPPTSAPSGTWNVDAQTLKFAKVLATTRPDETTSTSFSPTPDTHVTIVRASVSDASRSLLRSQQGRSVAEIFNAQGIAPELVAQLREALQSQFPGDEIRVTDEPSAATTAPAATEPGAESPAVVGRNQLLTVCVDQLSGPGVSKVNTVRVAADGTVTLPMMIEPVPAAGKSFAELDQEIAQRYRDANLIPNATVHTTAATQPAAMASPQTQPAPLAARPASTEPTVQPRLDLMVMVEMLPPATAPTTSPASAQP